MNASRCISVLGGLTVFVLTTLGVALPAHGASRSSIPHDFFAVVLANGVLARATPGTTVSHPAVGLYDVTFPGSVRRCAAVANLGYAGTTEQFTHVTAVTVATRGRTVLVDVTYPGDTVAGQYPHQPVLVNDSFHLHVDCYHALFANVAADGMITFASPGVTSGPHTENSGSYRLNFGKDISNCAPTATVDTPRNRRAMATQAFLALGSDGRSLEVSVNLSTTKAVDAGFSVIVTCGEEPSAVFPNSNGFDNNLTIPQALSCALTGNWYDPTPGSSPSDQGYVSTWATSTNIATIQTKNGGYGIEPGFGVDLVASC
jgi:hypothetical protein